MEGIKDVGFVKWDIKDVAKENELLSDLLTSLNREQNIWLDRLFVLENDTVAAEHKLKEVRSKLEAIKHRAWEIETL